MVKLPWTKATFIDGTKCSQWGREGQQRTCRTPFVHQHTDEKIDVVNKIKLTNRRTIIREVAENLNI